MKGIWKRWFKKNASANIESDSIEQIKKAGVPRHVAIIMDGNGRWAKKRALPRIAGHHEGIKVVQRMTRFANTLGVEFLTLYAFSTENWKRPVSEVDYLMKAPIEFLNKYLPELIEENVQVKIMGDVDSLPANTKAAVQKAMDDTSHNTGLVLNLAFNYGGRAEILQAVRQIAMDSREGNISAEELNEDLFSSHLMTKGLPDPDLLIRTSGEIRLSNFMLWQLAYSEFWFTHVLWPDFSEKDFLEAIKEYQRRSRRYGGL
ncbi:isoprenyl transferase [Bacillus sp. 1P06AnD]|uniref:isoprenyl transferase n=1 Tax=Bacillus sp. 1P06AnD TaxID=3132208 RepID=UPI0039A237EF